VEIAGAYVRIRPRADDLVPVLEALRQLAADVEEALDRCLTTLVESAGQTALDEGDQT
jgi:hypothetical protein